MLDLPDNIYNWLLSYFFNLSYCTKFKGSRSNLTSISASVIQGSALGPAAFIVTAADLAPCTEGNEMCKYADDYCLVISASNSASVSLELASVGSWAALNNFRLNQTKSKEIIFTRPDAKQSFLPPPSQTC